MIEIYTRNFDLHITVPSPNLAFLCRNLDYKPYSINILLCINDLANVSEKLFASLFADDTSVFFEGKDLAEITNTLNAELAKLLN